MCLILSALAFYFGDRYSVELLSMEGMWMNNIQQAFAPTIDAIVARPFFVSFDDIHPIVGLALCLVVLGTWMVAFTMPKPGRVGEEYGSARWGTLAEARRYMTPKWRARRRLKIDHA